MSKYFDKFPVIDYNGQIARNILAKVDFTEQSKRNIYSQFDFVLTDDASRPDLLSTATYNSPKYDWLIFIANDMIDPYYDYYLSSNKFDLYMKSKYGTYANAESQILYYRNNWAPDSSTIDESLYDALPNAIQKYYRPVLNLNNQITGYERNKEDWIVATNKIVDIYVDDTSSFSVNERITQQSTNAKATIIRINTDDSIVTVQHVDGAFANGALGTATISDVVLVNQSIPDEEAAFWAPVSAYDNEAETNELKKYISLIRPNFLPDIEKLFLEQIKK